MLIYGKHKVWIDTMSFLIKIYTNIEERIHRVIEQEREAINRVPTIPQHHRPTAPHTYKPHHLSRTHY